MRRSRSSAGWPAPLLLRWVLTVTAADSRSIYGPLAAPIAVLLWLYLLAIAVLIGAAVNAAFDTVFPQKATTRARLELVQRLRQRMSHPRQRGRVGSDRGRRRERTRPTGVPAARSRCRRRSARRGGSSAGACWSRSRSWSAPCCWSTSTATPTTTATTRPATVDLVDSIYYTTVTLSTTGYGDIAPVAPHARLINAFVVTPLRIAFLVLLIGTTLEVLASQGREMFRVARWRKKHGCTTSSSSATAPRAGAPSRRWSTTARTARRSWWSTRAPRRSQDAHADGLAVVTGDATRREVLRRAGVVRGQPGHHHHQPRRLQRAGDPHGAPAQPGGLDRRRGPRAGERRR